jgi:hypothetical protein
MAVFVVERYLVGWSPDEVHALLSRVGGASDVLAQLGVHHLRSVVIPGDETCLCVFEGPDAETVRHANAVAGLPSDRVVPGELLPG